MTDAKLQPGGKRRTVAVFGSSAPRPGDTAYETALRLGSVLAAAGFVVINGGHEGTMEAVSRGAQEGGAYVTGVSCAAIRQARGARPNAWIHRLIDAETLTQRIEIMMRSAGGYVFLPGGTGTLAELGLIAEHVHKGLIARRPLVGIGTTLQPILAAVEGAEGLMQWAENPEEAVAILDRNAIDTETVALGARIEAIR